MFREGHESQRACLQCSAQRMKANGTSGPPAQSPVWPREAFVTSPDRGGQRKGALAYKKQHPSLGILQLLLMLLQCAPRACHFALTQLTTKCYGFWWRCAVTLHSKLRGSQCTCPAWSCCMCLSGTIFGCTDVDLLVEIRSLLDPMNFSHKDYFLWV